MTDRRPRLGRTPTVILRQTVGDSYAIEAAVSPAPPDDFDPGYERGFQFEFDDGNGMWIITGVS